MSMKNPPESRKRIRLQDSGDVTMEEQADESSEKKEQEPVAEQVGAKRFH